jgi:Ca-activated chloride channel family protein
VTFLEPAFLPVGAAVALLVVMGMWKHANRRRRLAAFLGGSEAARRLSASDLYRPRLERMLLLAVATVAAAGAAAEPRWLDTDSPPTNRSVVVAIDVSASMQASDVGPTRLARAVDVAGELIDALDDDRAALLLFSGTGYVLAPPTSDHRVIRHLLSGVTPTMASAHDPGTLISVGLREAATLSGDQGAPGEDRWIVLISDGDTREAEDLPVAEARATFERGIGVHVVGVGTDEPTEMYMPRAPYQLGGPVLDERGASAVALTNESLLGRVAGAGGGRYVHEGDEAALRSLLESFGRPAAVGAWWARYDHAVVLILVALAALLVESVLDLRVAPLRRRRPVGGSAA